MIMETPLPTPFSVMRSPIQTRKAVPAVHTMPMVAYTYQAVLVTTPSPMPTTMPMLCTDARIPGDLFDLLPAVLLFGHALQAGDGNGQKLDDDGTRDVGGDTHGKDGKLAEATARKQVQEAQDIILARHFRNAAGVHKGHWNEGTQPVDHDQQKGEQHPGADVLDIPGVEDGLKH